MKRRSWGSRGMKRRWESARVLVPVLGRKEAGTVAPVRPVSGSVSSCSAPLLSSPCAVSSMPSLPDSLEMCCNKSKLKGCCRCLRLKMRSLHQSWSYRHLLCLCWFTGSRCAAMLRIHQHYLLYYSPHKEITMSILKKGIRDGLWCRHVIPDSQAGARVLQVLRRPK